MMTFQRIWVIAQKEFITGLGVSRPGRRADASAGPDDEHAHYGDACRHWHRSVGMDRAPIQENAGVRWPKPRTLKTSYNASYPLDKFSLWVYNDGE